MAHTPGPWKIVGESPEMIMVSITAGDCAIAGVFKYHPGNKKIIKISEDNARLIAAAPEMLKALQIAYAMLRRPETERDENRVSSMLNTLIAKIEGRE